jgi:4a-hydroxytetrahydrobiopterin dehydratase
LEDQPVHGAAEFTTAVAVAQRDFAVFLPRESATLPAMALPKLTAAEIAQRLSALNGWQREGDAIVKEFTLAGFTEATEFIAKLAAPANAMDHHPDVQLYRYKRVKILLTTHSAGGLTQNDFDLAAKIDAL